MTDSKARICGACGESCGFLIDGNANHRCQVLGTLWADDSPTGPAYIAHLLGVQRATVDQWIARGIFPRPSWSVAETGRPLWMRRVVLDWATETGRL